MLRTLMSATATAAGASVVASPSVSHARAAPQQGSAAVAPEGAKVAPADEEWVLAQIEGERVAFTGEEVAEGVAALFGALNPLFKEDGASDGSSEESVADQEEANRLIESAEPAREADTVQLMADTTTRLLSSGSVQRAILKELQQDPAFCQHFSRLGDHFGVNVMTLLPAAAAVRSNEAATIIEEIPDDEFALVTEDERTAASNPFQRVLDGIARALEAAGRSAAATSDKLKGIMTWMAQRVARRDPHGAGTKDTDADAHAHASNKGAAALLSVVGAVAVAVVALLLMRRLGVPLSFGVGGATVAASAAATATPSPKAA